jgi:hypothetical protein
VDALRALADPAEYERWSTAALENSRREELDPRVQLDELVRALEAAIATRPASR